jgi:hypothetical protein
MRTSKKILGVVMALMMLLNVVALVGYAMPASTVCELSLVADKEYYAAGDEITLTAYAQTSASSESVEMMGQYIWNYDSSAIEPIATTNAPADHGFAPADSQASAYDVSLSEAWVDDTITGMGEAADAGDKLFGLMIGEIGDAYVASQAAPVELFSFKMKVADTAADGEYTINWNASSFSNYVAFITDSTAGGIYGDVVTDFFPSSTDTTMWSFVPATIKVGAAGPVVSFSKAQVKMALNEGKTALAEVADPIQLRVTSTITDADWDTYFGNTVDKGTATTSAISSVGIVAYKGAAADFDEATAKALVTNGTAAANYTAAETTYIQKESDDADAFFGAIIKGSRADAFASDVTFLGFVKYYDADGNTQVAFYEAAVTKTITDTTVSDYITAMNA